MIVINSFSDKKFKLNNLEYAKIYQPLKLGVSNIGIYSIYDTRQQIENSSGRFDDFLIDGVVYESQEAAMSAILDLSISILSDADFDLLDNRVSFLEADNVSNKNRILNLEENQITGVQVYSTKEDEGGGDSFLPVSGTLLVSYKVSNDPTPSNNGYYHWSGSVYVKDAGLANGVVEDSNVDAVSGGTVYLDTQLNTSFEKTTNILEDFIVPFTELNSSNPGGVPNNDMQMSGFIPVSIKAFLTTTFWKSTLPTSSSAVFGYTDSIGGGSEILFSANDVAGPTGAVTITDEEITIPSHIKFLRFTNRYLGAWSITTYLKNNINGVDYKTDINIKNHEFVEFSIADGFEIRIGALATEVAAADGELADYIPVIEGESYLLNTALWKSSVADNSTCLVGYSDNVGSNPIILYNTNSNPIAVGNYVLLINHNVVIPYGVKFVRFSNKPDANIKTGFVLNNNTHRVIENKLLNSLLVLDTIKASEIRVGDINTVVPVPFSELIDYTPVIEGYTYLISTTLFRSTSPNNSNAIIGYSDNIGSDAIIIYNANSSGVPAGNFVSLNGHELIIPAGVKFIRFTNKLQNGIEAKFYLKNNVNVKINDDSELIKSFRGETIINNIELASVEGQSQEHDSQILVDYVGGLLRVLVIYRTTDGYYFNIISAVTKELISSTLIASTVGWAPRMYKKDSDTIRLVYTIGMTDVYYKDFTLSTASLGAETTFKVAIKVLGVHDTPVAFTLDRFLEHIANVSGIDYRDSFYDAWASRNLLVEDTQQLQLVDGKYYLTSEVLADGTPSGDTGGIACLMWSTDLDVWHLNDPVSISTDFDDQRDHEISATYLNGKWHALTRYNVGGLNIEAPAGHRYYTSDDGEAWTLQGLSSLPHDMNGIRHAVYVTDLKYAQPVGVDSNKFTQEVAFILYQKTPDIQGIVELDDTTHKLRTKLGLVYTLDFINFFEVADITDRANLTYPSITIYLDRIYMCWSSGFTGTGVFNSSIMWGSYNLGKI
jgi:hypothetical protein